MKLGANPGAYYLFVFAAVLIAPSFTFAWGPKGHQIVAYIAEAHLTDTTREKIKAILPRNGTLAKASIWPDEIKKALPQMNPLHYVDVPRGVTVYDLIFRHGNDCHKEGRKG